MDTKKNRSFRSGSTQHYEKKSSNVLIYYKVLVKKFFVVKQNLGESSLCIWLFRPIPQNSRTLQGASRLAAPKFSGRKVRATKSAILPNGKGFDW